MISLGKCMDFDMNIGILMNWECESVSTLARMY